MLKVFEIYLYICGIIVGIIILTGLIALALNLIVYCYRSCVGFDVFMDFFRKYNKEMQETKKSERKLRDV